METLHRLAGVQDASDFSSAQPAQPVSSSDPYAREPSISHEPNGEGLTSTLSHRASRASIPLNRQPSHKSLRDASAAAARAANSSFGPQAALPRGSHEPQRSEGDGTAAQHATADPNSNENDDNDDDDFAWGPAHPCFPHPNPHCAPGSSEAARTRVIRVRRDWLAAGDQYPQYANLYPEILDPLVSDADFRQLVRAVNALCRRAFAPFTAGAWLDAALGLATGYLWEDAGLAGWQRGAAALRSCIDAFNADCRAAGRDVRVAQLETTGFMSLDFIVPDPGLDPVAVGGGGGRGGGVSGEEAVGIGPAAA